ncbi:MAG: hypothetical protein ACXAEN_19170 [Candidatus Thorarchaeota archaeon]
MTRRRNFGEDTPYKSWLRNHEERNGVRLGSGDGFDLNDVDIVWFDYVRGYLMLIEEKSHDAEMTMAQKDTFGVLDQALKFAFPRMDFERQIPGRKVELVYFGYYVVQFENTSPDDGGIRINGQEVTEVQLSQFHQFSWFPYGSHGEQQLYELGGKVHVK